MTAAPHIRFIKIFVNDLPRAARFYERVFGFAESRRLSAPEFDEHVLAAPGDPVSIVLCRWKDGRPLVAGNARGPLGFAVVDVKERYELMLAEGGEAVLPPTSVGAAVIAVGRDPDGHQIELFHARTSTARG